jgi:hypothetical protein
MNPLERLLLLDQVSTGGSPEALSTLVVAFLLGLGVSFLHRFSQPRLLVPASLQASLALLPVITALVLLVIGDSLARSFALVGALAIVRFRTRLRSTWDISFVFFSLAVGIACGVGALSIAGIGLAVVTGAVLVLGALPGTAGQDELHLVRCDVSAWQCGEAQLVPVIDKHARKRWLTSARSVRFGESLSLTWKVHLRPGASLEALVREVSTVEGVERVIALTEHDGEGGGDD